MTSDETVIMRGFLSLKWLLIPACLLLSSCQTMQESPQPVLIEQQLEDSIAEQQDANKTALQSPPEEVQNALIPPMSILEDGIESEPRFDLAVNAAPAKEFFMGLVEGSGWNAVISPNVTGDITLDLKDVTVSLVMDIVREIYGYEYQINQNVYQIFPATMQTVMFPVNYLNIKRRGSSNIRVNSGEVADNYSSGSTNNSGNNFSNEIRQAGGNNSDSQHSTQIETSSENDFWKELETTLKLLIAGREQAQVVTSPQTNMVIVRALPADLRMISEYLRSMQSVLDRQVLLEAKILEVVLGDSFQSGIDWSSIASINGGNSLGFTQNGRTISNPNVSDGLAGILGMTYQNSNFEMMIDLLETQGLVQVLSSPRISTINNQKAVIKVGTDEFFVTDISSTTVAGAGSSTTSPDVTLTPFFSGIALDVTPQIDVDGNIVLHVHPSISEVEDQEKLLTLGTDTLTLPLAKSTIRESDSIIRARSGEVVVIGGLMQTQIRNQDSGVPLLNDIPIAGHLFNQKNSSSRKTELVILIRPIIIDDKTSTEYLRKSKQRIGNMGKNGN